MSKIFVGIDTETTGLLEADSADIKLQPHMTELYLVKFNSKFEPLEEFDSLFKIPIPVPELITKITKIDDEMLKTKNPFSESLDEVADFMTGVDAVVGHNINFDMNILKNELRRMREEFHFPWPRERICTVELSFPIEKKRLKLGRLYNLATGKEHEGAHRSKADTRATVKCFKWLCEKGFYEL